MRHDLLTKILIFWPLRLLENGFPTLKREANSSWQNIEVKFTLHKKVWKEKLFPSQIFFSCVQYVQAFWVQNWKNNSTIFMVSEIQAVRKLNNPTTTSFAGFFLTIVRSNLLEWWHSHKKRNLPFLFSLRNFSLYLWLWP